MRHRVRHKRMRDCSENTTIRGLDFVGKGFSPSLYRIRHGVDGLKPFATKRTS